MKSIRRSILAKSRTFINNQCRELEKQRFIHAFERENTAGVISALSAFQNSDGGFGHGLEPDFTLPDSSPAATSVACGILAFTRVSSETPIVRNAIKYLINTYDWQKRKWNTVPKQVNDYPHASWWHYLEDEAGTILDRHWGIPTATIGGYLLR